MKRRRTPSTPESAPKLSPPTGSIKPMLDFIRRLNHQNLPKIIAKSDIPGIASEQEEAFHAMRFLGLLTPTGQPTGHLGLLAAKVGRDLWHEELWKIVCEGYAESLGSLHPLTVAHVWLGHHFATRCGMLTKSADAASFFIALRAEAGLEWATDRCQWPYPKVAPNPLLTEHPAVPAEGPVLAQVQRLSPPLEIVIPLPRSRRAKLTLPDDYDRADLPILEAAIRMLTLSRE